MRNQLDRYAAPNTVDWHFAHIENRWTKRALAAAGFGFRSPRPGPGGSGHWKTIFSIADLGGSDSPAAQAALQEQSEKNATRQYDVERKLSPDSDGSEKDIPHNPQSARLVAIQGVNRPFFHFDLQEALEAAVENIERHGRQSD